MTDSASKGAEPLPTGSVIGILGGGQLGRMLSVAASRLGFRCHIFEPGPAPPAGQVAEAVTTLVPQFEELIGGPMEPAEVGAVTEYQLTLRNRQEVRVFDRDLDAAPFLSLEATIQF